MLNLLGNYENKLRPYLCPQMALSFSPTPPKEMRHTLEFTMQDRMAHIQSALKVWRGK